MHVQLLRYRQTLNSDNPRIVYTNLGFDLCAHNLRIVRTILVLSNELMQGVPSWTRVDPRIV